MKQFFILPLLTVLLFSCSPKNEEVKDEHIETGPPHEALDTIANTWKDAVQTDATEKESDLPMPQPVMQVLQEKYPGWQKPMAVRKHQQATTPEDETPALISGDFNGDNRQDYTLQLQVQKEIIITAVLSGQDEGWKVYELKRDTLFNRQGKLTGLYTLNLTPKGEQLYNYDTGKRFNAPLDAISVGADNSITTYLWESGQFKAYPTAD